MRLATAIFLAAFLLAARARAATLSVPAEFSTIQAALDAAVPGDVVEVACGTYFEHDITLKSGVVVRSQTGEADCVTIDAQGLGRVFFGHLLSTTTEVSGFTITGGNGVPQIWGGGLATTDSQPTISHCLFQGNTATLGGGAALMHSSNAYVDACVFRDNVSEQSKGHHLYVLNRSNPTIHNCLFIHGSVAVADPTRPTFDHCTLACPLQMLVRADAHLINTIVTGEVSCFNAWDPARLSADCSLLPPTNCPVQGSGNFFANPLFCDPTNNNFYLQWGSPCLPANSGGCGLIGAFGPGGCNSVSVAPESWGRIKAGYRE